MGYGNKRVRSCPDGIAKALNAILVDTYGDVDASSETETSPSFAVTAPSAIRENTPPTSLGNVDPDALDLLKLAESCDELVTTMSETPPPPTPRTGNPESISGEMCQDCGNASMVREEGCLKCYSCGHSVC